MSDGRLVARRLVLHVGDELGQPGLRAGKATSGLSFRVGLRSRFTPVHASWLDEAELLIGAFGYHYLKRGSWHSRAEFIDYVGQAWPEYNRLYAHPFDWTWSSQKMRQWVKKHGL